MVTATTMAKPSTITQWMQQPAKFTDEDRKSAAALLKAYPYFVPAKFMEAAEQQKKQPFAPSMMAMMQLYMGNWLLFYSFMQAANNTPANSVQEPLVDKPQPDGVEDEMMPSYEDEMDIDEMTDPLAGEEEFDLGDFDPEEPLEDDELILDGLDEEDEPFGFLADEEVQTPKPEEELFATTATPPQQQEEEPIIEEPALQPPVAEPELAVQKEKRKDESSITSVISDIPAITKQHTATKEDSLIQPIFTEDYFLHQGIQISDKVGAEQVEEGEAGKSLMVVMSFAEWLNFFKTKNEKAKEEQEDQRALKTMWQKEKLAAALEEENDEIPENVFEMAVNSITQEEGLASESLADILVKQGKNDKAIEMYRKLSLRNPHKNAYFANRIDEIIKGK